MSNVEITPGGAPGQAPGNWNGEGTTTPAQAGNSLITEVTKSAFGDLLSLGGGLRYQASQALRMGEIEPICGEIFAQSGDTITLQPAPDAPYSSPSFTLYDSGGAIIIAAAAIPDGNFPTGAQATVLFWYVLDTSALTPGTYVARLSAAVKSTLDTITRQSISEVQLTLLPVVDIVGTYDLSTPIGMTRLYCLDNDPNAVVFSDTEILQFLTDGEGVPMLAGSLALELLCVDALRLANAIRIGAYKNTSGSVYSALVERAAHLREIAPVAPVVLAPEAVFTTTDAYGNPGTMDVW